MLVSPVNSLSINYNIIYIYIIYKPNSSKYLRKMQWFPMRSCVKRPDKLGLE